VQTELDLSKKFDLHVVIWLLGVNKHNILVKRLLCQTKQQENRIKYIQSLTKSELKTALEAHKLVGM